MFAMFEEILVPIAFFAACVIVVYIAIQAHLKRRQMEHDERMLAIDKGVAVPAMPDKRNRPHNPFFMPFLFIAVGLGLVIANLLDGDDGWVWGLIPLFMGASMLLAHQRRDRMDGANHRPAAAGSEPIQP